MASCMRSPRSRAASIRRSTPPRSSSGRAAARSTSASRSRSTRRAASSSTSCTGRCRRTRWSRSCSEHARAGRAPMIVKVLGPVAYDLALGAMRDFTAARGADSDDEVWLCEHPPVFTQGVAGRDEHVVDAGDIAVVRSDRGGQVTYHGPGQVVGYALVDLKRLGIYVKEYVYRLEQALIKTLDTFAVTGHRVRGEPGVYVCFEAPSGHAVLPVPPPGGDPFAGLGKIAAIGV